jgi:hypothetical protein
MKATRYKWKNNRKYFDRRPIRIQKRKFFSDENYNCGQVVRCFNAKMPTGFHSLTHLYSAYASTVHLQVTIASLLDENSVVNN